LRRFNGNNGSLNWQQKSVVNQEPVDSVLSQGFDLAAGQQNLRETGGTQRVATNERFVCRAGLSHDCSLAGPARRNFGSIG